MGTSALKSATITNLDATPRVPVTTGEGAPGYLREVSGSVVAVAADAAGSTYKLVRLSSNAKVKSLMFESAAQGAGKVNLSVYYSDATNDGTQVANQGLIVTGSPGGDQFFASDIDCASAVVITEAVNESGNNPINLREQPLWQALGLTTDPGGYLDIVAVVHTTAITTGTGRLGVSARFVV